LCPSEKEDIEKAGPDGFFAPAMLRMKQPRIIAALACNLDEQESADQPFVNNRGGPGSLYSESSAAQSILAHAECLF
jgi:hypothetical protein